MLFHHLINNSWWISSLPWISSMWCTITRAEAVGGEADASGGAATNQRKGIKNGLSVWKFEVSSRFTSSILISDLTSHSRDFWSKSRRLTLLPFGTFLHVLFLYPLWLSINYTAFPSHRDHHLSPTCVTTESICSPSYPAGLREARSG